MNAKSYCSVINCHQNEKNSILHRFPKPNTPRFMEWLKATGNKRLLDVCPEKMRKWHYICRNHFAPQYLMQNNRISIVAVPTLFLPEPIEVPNITEPTTKGPLKSLESMFSDPAAGPSRSNLDQIAVAMDQTSSAVLQRVAVPTLCLPEVQDVPKISEHSRTLPLESRGAVAGELGQSSSLLQPQVTGRQLFEAEQFDKICRLCFSNLEIKPFFKLHFDGLLLFKIYQAITMLQIREEDSLPKHICMTCIEKIVDTYVFIKSCQESDKLLRSKIENSTKIKVEPIVNEEEFDIPSDQLIESQSNVNSPVIQDVQSIEQQSSDIMINQNPELLKLENKTNQSKIKPNLKLSRIHRFVERVPKLTGPPFSCNICSESFDTLSEFKYHYKRSSKCQPLILHFCPICNKKCVSENKVQLHMKSHTKERPFKCHICNEKFIYQQNFIRHKKRHTEEKL